MKQIFILGLLAVFSGFFACSLQNETAIADAAQNVTRGNETNNSKIKTPVLVELFTSEGCSSCPPADRVLTRLEQEQPNADAEIITLSLHVDYWNSLGWKDEFSSAIYSRRQDIYGQKFQIGSIYTPQMVVDGRSQFVGNNMEAAKKAIAENAKIKKAPIELSGGENTLKVKITDVPQHGNATVFLAIAESNLASNVSRGENSGKRLEHTSVVRELKSIGMLTPEQKDFNAEIALPLQANWKRKNVKFVVFVQENESRKILGVNRKSVD